MTGLKRILAGALMLGAVTAPLATPAPAQAWWVHGGYGWHGGWGWRGGVVVGGPVVVGPPVVVAPPVVYGAAPYRFIPGHYTPWGAWVPPHWGYY